MKFQKKSSEIEQTVKTSLQAYFDDLKGAEPGGLYTMVLRAVEKPLLEVVMREASGNQSRAAGWLGINRNTLRKKLTEHDLLGD